MISRAREHPERHAAVAQAMSDSIRLNPVGVVIVGSGAGKRFGGPKAVALLNDGRRFLDAIVETAKSAGLEPVVAVLPPDVAAPEGVRVVINAKAESEQIVSVRLGLGQLLNSPVTAALLWPVDHPFVELESVLAVLDAASRTAAPIVVPKYDGRRGHPTYFHRDVWVELMSITEGGARAVVHVEPVRVHEVEVRDVGVLRDIDTQRDLLAEK